MGWQLCWARERAARLGIRILCSVSQFPTIFSQKLDSISAGKGSLAPKSPKKSPPMARTPRFRSPPLRRVGEHGNEEDLRRNGLVGSAKEIGFERNEDAIDASDESSKRRRRR